MLGEQKKKKAFVRIKHKIRECKVHYENAAALVKELKKLPEENEAIYIWLQGNFIFGDFIIQYITENNLSVDELTIITLSIGLENIQALSELINKEWVKKINFLVSGYFLRTEKVKHTLSIQHLEKAAENNNFKVYHSNTHQKVAMIKLEDGRKIVMHGSANMKGSQNFEQVMIENSQMLYDFNYKYFKHLINKQDGKIR